MNIISRISAAATLLWIDAASAAESVLGPVPTGDGPAADGESSSVIDMGFYGIGALLIAAGLMELKLAADAKGKKAKYGKGGLKLYLGVCFATAPLVVGIKLLPDLPVDHF